MNVHKVTEHLQSWHLCSVVDLCRACTEALEAVTGEGGDPHSLFVQISEGTEGEANLAQLHKRTLTDDSCVYDFVIQ